MIRVILGIFIASPLWGQVDFNLELVAQVPNEETLSDVWGYVAEDSTEYAVIGTNTATEVYSLADPTAPELVHRVSGPSSIWRDIKSNGHYLYVVADRGEDGIVIINMEQAPENITSFKVNPSVNGLSISRCHNLFIEPQSQVLFLAGCNGEQGVLAFDITTDPENPTLINIISEPYAHDVFVRDNLVFASEIFDGEFSIFDITDIMNPIELGSGTTSSQFTHNAWSSADNQYVYTTDELGFGAVDAYDISDPMNPRRLDVFVPIAVGSFGDIPHNTHWMNDFLITSWYSYGVVISDVSNPEKIIEVGHYDTGDNPDCWGAYPYLPSGLILASDVGNGLFVLKPTYQRASYVSGFVTDASTGDPIFNAEVKISAPRAAKDRTDPTGAYITGDLREGAFEIQVQHPNYEPVSESLELQNGENKRIDFELKPVEFYHIAVETIDKASGMPLFDVDVQLSKFGIEESLRTNEIGIDSVFIPGGQYEIIAGKWGYKYNSQTITIDDTETITLLLEEGYEDDFLFDYGWTASASNERSLWVRDIPIGTFFGGQESNPSVDVDDDFGNFCYITGNDQGGAGAFDVDDGVSTLVSPIADLSMFKQAKLSFRPWFFNEGGSGITPNDSFTIYVTNGMDTVLLNTIKENTGGWADTIVFNLKEFISFSDSMQFIFEASDDVAFGHLVEAGVDQFRLEVDESVSTGEELQNGNVWTVSPNPAKDFYTITHKSLDGRVRANVYDSTGSIHSTFEINEGHKKLRSPEIPGIYYVRIQDTEGLFQIVKLVVL